MTDARIFDRGYRHYDGPRRGVPGAIVSLTRHSAQRALGLRRPLGAKFFPVLALAIAFIPAIVFVGIAAFVPDSSVRDDFLPSYGEYYGFVTSAILVFSAFVAPEVLCPDRRNGMLGLYLASPLTRDTYLIAKAASVLGVLSVATIGPPLLLLVANTLQNNGPDGPGDFLVLLGRVVVAGLAVSAAHTAVTLAVSSLTDRKAFASAGVIVLLIASSITTAILVENLDAPSWVWGFNLLAMPFELVQRVYGEHDPTDDISAMATGAVVAANALWVVASAAVVRWRYQRVVVTR
jgi:ABC-2 type transport system permease protein